MSNIMGAMGVMNVIGVVGAVGVVGRDAVGVIGVVGVSGVLDAVDVGVSGHIQAANGASAASAAAAADVVSPAIAGAAIAVAAIAVAATAAAAACGALACRSSSHIAARCWSNAGGSRGGIAAACGMSVCVVWESDALVASDTTLRAEAGSLKVANSNDKFLGCRGMVFQEQGGGGIGRAPRTRPACFRWPAGNSRAKGKGYAPLILTGDMGESAGRLGLPGLCLARPQPWVEPAGSAATAPKLWPPGPPRLDDLASLPPR
ncbi:MAG: hypothetical protein ABWY08_19770 [Comamonas sp.]